MTKPALLALALLATLAILWPAPLPGTASEAQQPEGVRPSVIPGAERGVVPLATGTAAAVLRPTPRPGELGTLSPAASPPLSRRTRGAVTLDGRRAVTSQTDKRLSSRRSLTVRQSRPVPTVESRYGVPWLTASGVASHMGKGYPATYLALPHGPGWLARICGAADCVVMVSNDAGPALYLQRQGRIADLSVRTFEKVCGVPASRGLCPVSVAILGRAR